MGVPLGTARSTPACRWPGRDSPKPPVWIAPVTGWVDRREPHEPPPDEGAGADTGWPVALGAGSGAGAGWSFGAGSVFATGVGSALGAGAGSAFGAGSASAVGVGSASDFDAGSASGF